MELEELIARLKELSVNAEKTDDVTVLLCKAAMKVNEIIPKLISVFESLNIEFRILGTLEHPIEGTTIRLKMVFQD